MGMGQATLFTCLCHRHTASSLPVLCHCPSQLAVGGLCLTFPQPGQALWCGAADTHRWGKTCPPAMCYRTVSCAWPQSGQAVPGKHRATVPCQHTPRGETLQPPCQQLRAATAWCQLMLLWLPCPLQTQGGPWGLCGREGELGGGRVQLHKARHWQRADGVSSENI